jgi:hypothetical protein
MRLRTWAGLLLVAGLLFAPNDTIALISGLVHHLQELFRSFNLH